MPGHLPRGRCGLKSLLAKLFIVGCMSPSARKVWIEIPSIYPDSATLKSPSARKVWIEIREEKFIKLYLEGHLPRGRCGLKSPALAIYIFGA